MLDVDQNYGEPDTPKPLPTFKDYVAQDVETVFFNLNEFAEERYIDDKQMLCITQHPGVNERAAHWEGGAKQSFDQGMYWTEKSKKWLTNGGGGCIIFFVSGASMLRAKPNSGDLHSGSAVDSDSTCGSSILSSPTRPQPIGLRYFRGIAQLVARLVRDEEAVGSNPAAPT